MKTLVTEFRAYWASKPNLPKIRVFNGERSKKLAMRMKDPDFAANWREVIDKISNSPFCCGQNDRGWKADVTWLLANGTNYVKALEGRYEQRTPVEVKTKLFPISGKNCYKKGCKMPAVYKSCGEYDTFYCLDHMPDEVKRKYA